MHTIVAGGRARLPARASAIRPALATRTCHSAMYSGQDGDTSKCPFFGGPNGGGLGDANIATAICFVLAVVVLRLLLVRFFTIGPRRVLASLMVLMPRAVGATCVPSLPSNLCADTTVHGTPARHWSIDANQPDPVHLEYFAAADAPWPLRVVTAAGRQDFGAFDALVPPLSAC